MTSNLEFHEFILVLITKYMLLYINIMYINVYIVDQGVTLEEFIEIMAPTFQSIRDDPMEKVMREAFDIFDEDKNGFISGNIRDRLL